VSRAGSYNNNSKSATKQQPFVSQTDNDLTFIASLQKQVLMILGFEPLVTLSECNFVSSNSCTTEAKLLGLFVINRFCLFDYSI